MLRTLLTRLAALTALTFTTAHAASGCTALYATVNYGTGVALDFVNTTTNTSSLAYNVTGMNTAIKAINAASLNPVNGQVYFLDRTDTAISTLYAFNPNTNTVQLIGTVPLPAVPTGSVAGNNVPIGATFDNSTGTARLFLLYGTYTVQEVNPANATVIRTINVNFPATDAGGATATKRTNGNGFGTSGDIVFSSATAYAVFDGVSNGTAVVYWATLGNIGSLTGTTATATIASSGLRRITTGGANLTQGAVNGAAITPFGETYISYTIGTTYSLSTLDTTGTATVPITTTTTNVGRAYTDLSDCTVQPDVPFVTKAFSTSPATAPATIRTGQNATLTITLQSGNPSPSYLLTDLTDTLPTGVTVASTPNVSTTCLSSSGSSPTITAAPNSGSVTIPTGTRVPATGSTCTVTLTVTGTSLGQKTNLIPGGSLQTTGGTFPSNVTASLLVNDPITGTTVKRQRLYPGGTLTTSAINAKPKELVEYCITATHPGVGYAPATVANVTDTLNANLSFVTGSATQGYGVGQDLKITRNGGAATYQAYGSNVTGQTLTFNIMPFNSANATVEVCFIAQVK